MLVIDNDKKRREQKPAPLSTINGETLQAMNLDDACRYLGYWGTGNGDMRATKDVVRQKIIAARDLIKCHPLTPELATEFSTRYNETITRRAQGCKQAGCRRRQERRSSPSDSFNSKHFTNSYEARLYPNPLVVNVSEVFLHTIGVSESL